MTIKIKTIDYHKKIKDYFGYNLQCYNRINNESRDKIL